MDSGDNTGLYPGVTGGNFVFYHAKNGTAAGADHIRFGTGKKNLIMLPGLGDGLRTTKGTALPMALYYRCLAKEYTVYMFSRKTNLPEGCTTRDMAKDLKDAKEELGIQRASLVGVSMGGMIAQHFAADYPEKVEKLVLVATCARENPVLLESLEEWIACARAGDHTALMDSNLRRIYSDDYYRKNKWMIPITGKLTKPRSYDWFLRLAEACRSHDAFERLPSIAASALVLGGETDNCLGAEPSRELAARIPGAELKMYPQWGHGLYEEAPDFQDTVLQFLKK
jgi:pimeloyl-ACP methyl ester carboxylesterase